MYIAWSDYSCNTLVNSRQSPLLHPVCSCTPSPSTSLYMNDSKFFSMYMSIVVVVVSSVVVAVPVVVPVPAAAAARLSACTCPRAGILRASKDVTPFVQLSFRVQKKKMGVATPKKRKKSGKR